MVDEVKAKKIITELVYQSYDGLGYGEKIRGFGSVQYKVKDKIMTVNEYRDYCLKRLLKKFDIK
jgi:hypothetical protein